MANLSKCFCGGSKLITEAQKAAAKWQERTYGNGLRVFTSSGIKTEDKTKSRCTVCGEAKPVLGKK